MAAKPPIAPTPPDLPEDLVAASPPAKLAGAEIEQSTLEHVDLSGAALEHAALRDVIVDEGSWANVRARGIGLRRIELRRVRLTGADFAEGVLEDVRFVDCRLDLASFRRVTLSQVRFEGCRMEEADFSGATLSSCVFEDCVLTRGGWSEAMFTRSEMRRVDLAGAVDPARLRDVRMPWADVVNAASELAAAVGIEIID